FLILKNTVLVPAYGCVRDESALQQLAHAMPNYNVTSIDCRALLAHGIDLNNIALPLPEGALYGPPMSLVHIPEIIVHRGARGERPENMMASFHYTAAVLVAGIDIDVRMSQEEGVVV